MHSPNMKWLLDLSKQPFPEEEISKELISSVTISTLNTWIIEKGLTVENFKKANCHAREAALLDYISRSGPPHDNKEEEEEEEEEEVDPTHESDQCSDSIEDNSINDEENALLAATLTHVSKKFNTELVDKQEIIRDVVMVSE